MERRSSRISRPVAGLVLAGLVALGGCATGHSREPSAAHEFEYGARMAKHGFWQEALFRFRQVVAREPKNARAHNNLAVALEANGEFAAAFEEYKTAVSLDSVDKSIHQNYTRFAEFYTAYTKKVGKVNPAP